MRRLAIVIALGVTATLGAQEPGTREAPAATEPSLIARFLSHDVEPVVRYRATRRLEAENGRFNVKGWMEVATELSPETGFTWTVIDEGGSGYIRNKVLRRTLEGEAQAVRENQPAKAALTEANYTFSLTPAVEAKASRGKNGKSGKDDEGEDATAEDVSADGHLRLFITPKRKDMMLVNGAVTVAEVDADLVQIAGRLAKTPSFWTRSVDIVRRYARVGGIRVPVLTESTANVRIAGRSEFRMTYQYQMINGKDVASTSASR